MKELTEGGRERWTGQGREEEKLGHVVKEKISFGA